MKIFKYIWNIITNIIQLLIILGIFNYVNSWFETIVTSLLILIYITINFYIIWYWHTKDTERIWFTEEFIRLRILLKDSELDKYNYKNDIYLDSLEEQKEALERKAPRILVSIVFSFIFYVICILNIFITIMN